METPTVDQLKRFVDVRNNAMLQTNLQFMIDAELCGVGGGKLGQAYRLPSGNGYRWYIPDNGKPDFELVETGGLMALYAYTEVRGLEFIFGRKPH